MEPIDYDAEYARLLREIETLPEDQREGLRQLHAETVERHEQITEAREKNQAALVELQQKLREMADGFHQIDAALTDLRLVAKMALFDLEARQREQRGQGGSNEWRGEA